MRLPPVHLERLSVWYCRKPIGGFTGSIRTGISLPPSRPSAASSRTQAECIDFSDQRTTTASDFCTADSISVLNSAPLRICRSHHTEWPCASRAAAIGAARA